MSGILDLVKNRLYQGVRGATGTVVLVDGRPLRHIVRHSLDGFEWSYAGSGPADLALALLTDAIGPDAAYRDYMDFKFEVVAKLPHNGWTLTRRSIIAWVQARAERRDARVYAAYGPAGAEEVSS